MKEITIIRHAKSSWEQQVTDFDRPLKDRGLNDSKLVSLHVKNKINKPDLVLSSDANRARSTAKIFIKNLNYEEIQFQLINELYDFSGEDLIDVIKNCEDLYSHLMIFGHNYAITSFVNTFGSERYDNVPTSGLINIAFNIDSWKNISRGKTILKVFPKDLK